MILRNSVASLADISLLLRLSPSSANFPTGPRYLRSGPFSPSIAKMSAPFPYKSDKAVLWSYDMQGSDGRQDASVMRIGTGMPAAKITNISDTSGMTHSGRVFAPPELPAR